MPGPVGQWNPDGRHAFRLENVTVRSAVGENGPAADPVVGLRLATRGLVPAKLVDLDTDQQLVSEIFGLVLALVDAAGLVLVEGAMRPAAFTDIWRRGPVVSDESASATYQSTLDDVRWGDVSSSPLLTRLRDATGGGPLSIKFDLDGYSMQRTVNGAPNPRFTRGRIAGTLGPAADGEPRHTVLGRQFGSEQHRPGAAAPGFRPDGGVNYFPGVVDPAARKVCLDLGNALPVATAGGAPQDLGELVLVCRAADGTEHDIGAVGYRAPGWYETTAGVVDLPPDRELSDDELTQVAAGRLVLVARPAGPQRTLSEEAPDHVRADTFVARLDPGDQWVVRLHVTRRGEPVAGARVNLVLLRPPGAPQFPVHGLTFPASVTTDPGGVAEATLTAADPGDPRFFYTTSPNRRVHVDGQVYRVGYEVDGAGQPNPSSFLSVLVWNAFVPDDPPTWHGSMRRLLAQYGDLYPWMTRFGPQLDMAEYEHIAAQREAIVDVLGRDVTDPRYMPVSRDMSGSRRKAVLTWLTNLGPDGRPLLGAPPVPAPRPPAPPVAAAPEALVPEEAGGKTAAAARLRIAPR
ncbi:hypothetical protein BJF78_23485 [Pseudonocardia sp. CNS-139]|nr:hypothetical protein BJF78_23485 [Pseudonocardia sp. CNS-139]